MSLDQLSATYAALADPTRRAILARLATGETSVTELAEPFEMSLPAVSKHLKVLERAGLIARGRKAQFEVKLKNSLDAQGQWDGDKPSAPSYGDFGADLRLHWEQQ